MKLVAAEVEKRCGKFPSHVLNLAKIFFFDIKLQNTVFPDNTGLPTATKRRPREFCAFFF